MEKVHVIRHKVLVDGLSVRQVARDLGVGRNTIDGYLDGRVPQKRVQVKKRKPIHDEIEARIIEILDDSPKWTHGKQKLTAKRLWKMLVDDEKRDVGYTFVKDVVREYRRRRREVFVPLTYRPGEVAEVDFFEVVVVVNGAKQKAYMFVMRLMYSGRDFAVLYPRQDSTCFLDGHVRAFAHFGGVPWRIIYDNLRAAVAKIVVGSERKLAMRFQSLAAHYAFEPCFARPATGHDKGGVEVRGKIIRWQHLVPVPIGSSLDEISATLQTKLDGENDAGKLDDERKHFLPLPASFSPARVTTVAISRSSLAKVDGAAYSVPWSYAGLDATVHVGVFHVDIVCPGGERVRHTKQAFGGKSVDYHHYLRELRSKPQAVRQVADVLLAQLGEPFDSLWRSLAEDLGEKEAARRFAKVLGAVDDHGKAVVAARIHEGKLSLLLPRREPAIALVAVPDALKQIHVEKSDIAAYDVLLGGAL